MQHAGVHSGMQLRTSPCKLLWVMARAAHQPYPPSMLHICLFFASGLCEHSACMRPCFFKQNQHERLTNLHCDSAPLGRASAAAVRRARRLADGDAQSVAAAARMRCSLRAARAVLARRPCMALSLTTRQLQEAHPTVRAPLRGGTAGLCLPCSVRGTVRPHQ